MENKVVKVKKEVQLVNLLDYGFKFDPEKEQYLRPFQNIGKDIYFTLVVELKTREVFYQIFNAGEEWSKSQEPFNVGIYPIHLLQISHLLEVIDI